MWAWPNKGRGQKVGVAFKAVAYGLGREREYGRGEAWGRGRGAGFKRGGVAIVWRGGVVRAGACPRVGRGHWLGSTWSCLGAWQSEWGSG